MSRHSTRQDREAAAKARFDKDTAEHQMTVLHDTGLYRHLHFQAPGSSFYWFDVITWPGHLTLNGDMGTWTFARDTDMLAFFRNNPDRPRINVGYWGEKLHAGNLTGNRVCEEYDGDLYVQLVNEHVAEFLEPTGGTDWPEDVQDELRQAVKGDVLEDEYGNTPPAKEDSAHGLVSQFQFKTTRGEESYGFEFCDTWEWSLCQPSVHFLWVCWAIVHAIAAYDATLAERNAYRACDNCGGGEWNCAVHAPFVLRAIDILAGKVARPHRDAHEAPGEKGDPFTPADLGQLEVAAS